MIPSGTIVVDSPIGSLTLHAADGRITSLRFGQPNTPACPVGESGADRLGVDPVLGSARDQLVAYFQGELERFDLPLHTPGTAFQQRVWRELLDVTPGRTISYAELAQAVGSPGAVRAVGQANAANPIPIIIPCHRVVRRDGTIGGYAAGSELKQRLLTLEGSQEHASRA